MQLDWTERRPPKPKVGGSNPLMLASFLALSMIERFDSGTDGQYVHPRWRGDYPNGQESEALLMESRFDSGQRFYGNVAQLAEALVSEAIQ